MVYKLSIKQIRNSISVIAALVTLMFGSGILKQKSQQVQFLTPVSVASQSAMYRVTKVVDGDTVNVSINGETIPVRLLGIDTPEVVDSRKIVQCFGKEASEETKKLLINKSVRLEADQTQGDTDQYHRLLRYVFLLDGTLVNDHLIRNGFAFEYTYHSIPYTYQNQFKQAEHDARMNKRGLWADNTCAGVR
jgi:micrococcal nuclease